jgi:hypothetical protein
MFSVEYRASRTDSPITVSVAEAVLLQALRTGRWWARWAQQATNAGDELRAATLRRASEQCKTAALYWVDQCLVARRTWRLPVLGVRLTKAQHRMIRDCCRYRPEKGGECEWLHLLAEHPPVR